MVHVLVYLITGCKLFNTKISDFSICMYSCIAYHYVVTLSNANVSEISKCGVYNKQLGLTEMATVWFETTYVNKSPNLGSKTNKAN